MQILSNPISAALNVRQSPKFPRLQGWVEKHDGGLWSMGAVTAVASDLKAEVEI